MSLEKRVLHVPLDGGLSEGDHPYKLQPPGHSEVINGRYLASGAIAKRFGYEVLPTLVDITPNWGAEGGLHTVAEHDGRVIAAGHDGAVAHDELRGSWTPLGRRGPRPSQCKTDSHVRQNNTLRHCDAAVWTMNGADGDPRDIVCTVYHDAEADSVWYVWHEVPRDGRPPVCLYGPVELSGNNMPTRCPRVAVSNGIFIIVGTDNSGTGGTDLLGALCDVTTGYVFGAGAVISAALVSANVAAVEVVGGPTGDNGFWICFATSGVQFAIVRLSLGGGLVIQATQLSTGNGLPLAMDYIYDGVTRRLAVATTTGRVVHVVSTLVPAVVAVAIITPTATTLVHAATICQGSVGGSVVVCWSGSGRDDTDGGGLNNFGTDVCLLTSAFALFRQTLVGQTRLGGCAAWDGVTSTLIPLCNAESDGGTSFLPFHSGYIAQPCDDDGTFAMALVASYGIDTFTLKDAAWDLTAVAGERYWVMPSLLTTGEGRFLGPYPVLVDESSPLEITCGVDFMRFSTVGSAAMRTVPATSIRLFQAGHGVSYTDGVFHGELTPPPPIYVAGGTVPGFTTVRDYGATSPSSPPGSPPASLFVRFAIRWTDAKGNAHRSLVSNELTLPWWILDAGTYYAARWAFPRPFPCSALGDRGMQYHVEVYQADVSGGTYYFRGYATPVAHPTLPACDYIVPRSVAPLLEEEVQIVTAPSNAGTITCWVDEGELQHVPPPPFTDICSTQDRLWGLNAERGRLEVWPSKAITAGYAPEFAPTLLVRIPTDGGECTGIAALDDKVVIFKERAIFVLFGDPGNNNGEGSTLQSPRLISSDVGCSNPNSIVEGPFGVAFQSSSEATSGRAGIHVIGRDTSISYPGQAAKTLSAGVTFGSGALLSPEKEVRWTMSADGSDARVLVWSYDVDRWHMHSPRASVSTCVARGRYIARLDEETIVRDKAVFDSDDIHEMSITTPWIKVADFQGFVRLWLSMFLIRHYTGGVDISIQNDYRSATIQGASFSASAISAMLRKQLGIDHRFQKLESVRFLIVEDTANNGGQGFELVSLAMEVGVKKGTFRRWLPSSNRR